MDQKHLNILFDKTFKVYFKYEYYEHMVWNKEYYQHNDIWIQWILSILWYMKIMNIMESNK